MLLIKEVYKKIAILRSNSYREILIKILEDKIKSKFFFLKKLNLMINKIFN